MSDTKKSQMEGLVARLAKAIDAIPWEESDKHPVLRKEQTDKRIEAFEEREGYIPEEYREFLRLANGMEGVYTSDWSIRGTSEVRVGMKYKTLERNFLPSVIDLTSEDTDTCYFDEESPCQKNAYIVGSNFDQCVAFLRRTKKPDGDDPGAYGEQVELYEAPDMITRVTVFDSFADFVEFVVLYYEVKAKIVPSESTRFSHVFTEIGVDEEELDFSDEYDLDEEFGTRSTPTPAKLGVDELEEDSSAEEEELYLDDEDEIDLDGEDYDEEFEEQREFLRAILDGARGSTSLKNKLGLNDDAADKLARAVEEPPKRRLSPEVQMAADMIEKVVQSLLDEELLELTKYRGARENLEDAMLTHVIRSRDSDEAVEAWFDELVSSKYVEDLYGTDSDVMYLLYSAFDEFDAEHKDED